MAFKASDSVALRVSDCVTVRASDSVKFRASDSALSSSGSSSGSDSSTSLSSGSAARSCRWQRRVVKALSDERWLASCPAEWVDVMPPHGNAQSLQVQAKRKARKVVNGIVHRAIDMTLFLERRSRHMREKLQEPLGEKCHIGLDCCCHACVSGVPPEAGLGLRSLCLSSKSNVERRERRKLREDFFFAERVCYGYGRSFGGKASAPVRKENG